MEGQRIDVSSSFTKTVSDFTVTAWKHGNIIYLTASGTLPGAYGSIGSAGSDVLPAANTDVICTWTSDGYRVMNDVSAGILTDGRIYIAHKNGAPNIKYYVSGSYMI